MTSKVEGYNNPETTGSVHDDWANGIRLKASDNSHALAKNVGDIESVSEFSFDISDRGTVIDGITIRVEANWSPTDIDPG